MEIIRKTIETDEEYLRQNSIDVDLMQDNYPSYIEILEKFCLENICFALAAVQIGIPKRIIYLRNTNVDVPLDDMSYNESRILINPVVISKKGHTKYWEACFSCLDNFGLVSRPYEMQVEYYDENGNLCSRTFSGFEATVLSHELDHLNGVLHMDIAEKIIQMPKDKRALFRKEHPYEIISKDCEFVDKDKIKK